VKQLEVGFPRDLTTVPRYVDAGGPCAGKAAGTCRFDTVALGDTAGHKVETVTHSGRRWSFTDDVIDLANGESLTSIANYATPPGPCANQTGTDCHFDTMAFDLGAAEIVTAGGKLWRFTGATLDPGYPVELSSISYLSASHGGPCP